MRREPGETSQGRAEDVGDSAQSRSAVVVGGTGLVGGALLQILSADARYRSITSLVRRVLSMPRGIDAQHVDFERLDGVLLPPIDDAFCCLGTTRRDAGSAAAFRRVDLDYVVAFAHLAKRSGARRFMLVSSLGASSRSPFLYPRTKGECETAVSAIGFATIVILRPSFLLGDRAHNRPLETVATRAGRLMGPLLLGPLRRYAPVEASAVARTLVRSAAAASAGVTVIESDAIR
jgi:uncharacterized protein YbjT (DUF2867 family)